MKLIDYTDIKIGDYVKAVYGATEHADIGTVTNFERNSTGKHIIVLNHNINTNPKVRHYYSYCTTVLGKLLFRE